MRLPSSSSSWHSSVDPSTYLAHDMSIVSFSPWTHPSRQPSTACVRACAFPALQAYLDAGDGLEPAPEVGAVEQLLQFAHVRRGAALEVVALQEVVEVVRLLEVVQVLHLVLESLEEPLVQDVAQETVRVRVADGLLEGGLDLGHRRRAGVLGVEDDLGQHHLAITGSVRSCV
jgi:hypothetical protein